VQCCSAQALVQQLLVDISRHVPACALDMLAGHILAEPTNLEMTTIGLRSLLAVTLSPPTYDSHWVREPLGTDALVAMCMRL